MRVSLYASLLVQIREPSAALIYVRKGTSRSKAPAPLSVCLRGESPGLAFIRALQSSPGSHPRNSPGHQFRGLIPAGQSCSQTFQPRALWDPLFWVARQDTRTFSGPMGPKRSWRPKIQDRSPVCPLAAFDPRATWWRRSSNFGQVC